MRVTAVLFDVGGTLFGYERREQMGSPAGAALERLGLVPDDPVVREARRTAFEAVEREYALRPSFIHRDLFRDRIARTAELLGITAPDHVLARFDDENRAAILEHLVPRPDAGETLRQLRERGLYTAVVSNADDDYLGDLLERHGLADLLDDWTSSEEAGSCKPHRLIYDHALGKAGRVAGETVFVGDSLPHDIAGAHMVGMRTVLVGEPNAVAPLSHGLDSVVPAEFEVRALLEVVAVVDQLNGAR